MASPVTSTPVGSADDPRLDDFRDLTNADRRPDRPGGRGLVIAEGVPVVERLIASPYPVRAVMGVASRIAALEGKCDAPMYVVPVEVMDAVVGFHLNRGVLACADRAPMPSLAELTATASRLLVLEGVGDHENLGSLFRNAAAFGIDGVVLGPRCSDPLYRRAVRVSMGNVLRVPFCAVDAASWPGALHELRAIGYQVLAMTPAPPAVRLSSLDPELPRVAVLVGAEGLGLTAAAMAAASRNVRIPMADGVDSLNVATAAAIALAHFADR
ncbi:TrmH family RNA methyltransferase [Cumulibacter manganitolerans]|uniref:TrmH family RNA methyltransferase n=1 Tax=Cumulibacter manganitolerans TaxID=1884992 RepID=UPI001297DA45|nr:RNA methyltransferase [Cumulibacter manganitolerans]